MGKNNKNNTIPNGNEKYINAEYMLSIQHKLGFDEKGNKVRNGEAYVLLESARGRSMVFSVNGAIDLFKDLGKLVKTLE